MFEKIIFAVISVIMAGFAVSLLEGLGTLIFPIPNDFDHSDIEALRENMHRIPIGAKWVVVIAHLAGAAVATYLGGRLTRNRQVGLICGLVLLGMTLFDLALLPHPTWFRIVDPLAALTGVLIAYRILPEVMEQDAS